MLFCTLFFFLKNKTEVNLSLPCAGLLSILLIALPILGLGGLEPLPAVIR